MRNRRNYIKRITKGALVLMLMNVSSSALAGDKENHIIAKSVEAYGGQKLIGLQSLSLTDKLHYFDQWQSGHSAQGAMIGYLDKFHVEFTVDFQNQRKVFKKVTTRVVGSHGTDLPTITHRVFADGKGHTVDHALQHYKQAKNVNFNNTDLAHSKMLDPLIIKQLNEEKDAVTFKDVAYIQGQAHDVLTVNGGKDNEYTVYLNQNTGYLTRVLRNKGQQMRSYDFLEHNKSQGIAWAKQLFVSTGKKAISLTDSREMSFNTAKDSLFKLPVDYKPTPKTQWYDVSKMTMRQLAQGIYFVGQDWGYTLFIDAGDHYISAGSWQMDLTSHAWKNGYEYLVKQTGIDKPVKKHVVTHHHHDHMMGLGDILKQDAKLVIHPEDIVAVQEHLKTPLSDDRFIKVKHGSSLLDGKVKIFDVPNSHANHNLIIYLPEHKILFTEDMFGSSYKEAFHSPVDWPNIDVYHRLDVLVAKIEQLGLDVDTYLSSHHGRILNQAEIDQARTVSRPAKNTLIERVFAEKDGSNKL